MVAACCLLASLVGSVEDERSTESVIVTLYVGSGVVRPGAMVIDREKLTGGEDVTERE